MRTFNVMMLAAALGACATTKPAEQAGPKEGPPATSATGEKLRIAVKPLRAKGVDAAGTSIIESQLCTELFNAHADAVCPDDLKAILATKQTQLELGACDNDDDTACAQKIAAASNTNRVLTGEIGKLEDNVVLTLSMVDVGSSAVVGRATEKAGSLGDLPAKLPGMLKQVLH